MTYDEFIKLKETTPNICWSEETMQAYIYENGEFTPYEGFKSIVESNRGWWEESLRQEHSKRYGSRNKSK